MLGTPVLHKENQLEDHRHHPRIVDDFIRTGTTQRRHYPITSAPGSFRSKICRNDSPEPLRSCVFVWSVRVRTFFTPKRSHNAAKSMTGYRGPLPVPVPSALQLFS